jgi:hypothetical protein
MPVLFANPWGLLALLGIPVVLAIHFLHRHRQAIPVSTLFLIEIAREPARSGRRWHRLLPSIPMWLQLLLVLLLAALLSRPYLPQGVLQVAVVVDDSASMRAFRTELANRLTDLHGTSRTGRRSTQWLVLAANPTRPRLYAGENPADWIASLATWSPAGGWRDPAAALRLARDRVGPEGLVVYATDTPRADLPSGAALLSVGQRIDNVGIGGVTVMETEEGVRWQAVLVNPSTQAAQRHWALEWNGAETTAPQSVSLPAHGMATLGGALPENATRLVLRLSPDDFTLDDAFPFVRPAPKPLAMATLGDGVPPWLPERMLRSIPRLSAAPAAAADFALIGIADATSPPPVAGVVFSTAGQSLAGYLGETIAPTTHPLVRGLAWAGLAVQDVPAPPYAPGDTVLLWSGNRPLASLRMAVSKEAKDAPRPPPVPQLVLHFNPSFSNFDRIPASAILLLRFAESLRASKSATAWEQLEPGQSLASFLPDTTPSPLVVETITAAGTVSASNALTVATRTPDEPGFLRVRDNETIHLEAAIAFADARESDFRQTATSDSTADAIARAARVSTPSDDFMRPLILLAALAALLILYHFSAVPPRAVPSETA